jgi:hypothetical protein
MKLFITALFRKVQLTVRTDLPLLSPNVILLGDLGLHCNFLPRFSLESLGPLVYGLPPFLAQAIVDLDFAPVDHASRQFMGES